MLNQILSVESYDRDNNKSNKKQNIKNNNPRGPIEINKIVKFFSIVIIIFGILMAGTGSYSMYKNSQQELAKVKPTIHVEEIAQAALLLKVTHNKPLAKVNYKWNDGDATEIECTGKKEISQEIEIPKGKNILEVYANDINGQEVKFKQQYKLDANIDVKFENDENDGNYTKITVTGEEELSYLTYRWDEEEETRVDINDTKIEQKIETPKGLHTLTVIVVDINNQTITKTQDVQGVTRPNLEVTTDGSSNFIIKASDEQGLKRIELIIDETKKYKADLTGRKEFEYKVPLKEGENKIQVTIYNENDISETSKKKVTKPAQ